MKKKALCIITGKGATLHWLLILGWNVHSLLHRLSACLEDRLASVQGDHRVFLLCQAASSQNSCSLERHRWPSLCLDTCLKEFGKTICMERSRSSNCYRIICLLPVVGVCSGMFQNDGAQQQLVDWTVRNGGIMATCCVFVGVVVFCFCFAVVFYLVFNCYWFCKALVFPFLIQINK